MMQLHPLPYKNLYPSPTHPVLITSSRISISLTQPNWTFYKKYAESKTFGHSPTAAPSWIIPIFKNLCLNHTLEDLEAV